MATYTVEQIYDYLRFGECGNFVQFQCKQRTVTIRRLTRGIDTMPTCLIGFRGQPERPQLGVVGQTPQQERGLHLLGLPRILR